MSLPLPRGVISPRLTPNPTTHNTERRRRRRHHPQDVYEFAARHFSRVHSSHKDKMLRPLVICGPSGVGKGTLLNLLFQEFGGDFGFSVSHVRFCVCMCYVCVIVNCVYGGVFRVTMSTATIQQQVPLSHAHTHITPTTSHPIPNQPPRHHHRRRASPARGRCMACITTSRRGR
jgi:hypothetical protein